MLESVQTALITGAGREPARSVALALAHAGYRLALNDLTPQRLEETADLARAAGGQVSLHIGDPSKGLFARGLLEEAWDRWDDVTALVNCPRAEPRLPLLELDEWDFQRTLETNVGGPFLLTQIFCRHLIAEGKAGIVFNLVGVPPTPPQTAGQEAFYTSQMALRALTAAAASGLASHAIRIYALTGGAAQAAALAARIPALLDERTAPPSGAIFDLWEAG